MTVVMIGRCEADTPRAADAVLPRPAVDAAGYDALLTPLAAALTAMQARHGPEVVRGLPAGLVPADEGGWTAATALVDGTALPDLLDAAKQRWNAQPAAAAALAWKSYTYWLAMPAVVGYVNGRRIPLPYPEDVLVRYHDRQPFLGIGLRSPTVAVLASDPLAAAPDARAVRDDAALLGELRRALLDAHLDPLVDRTREHVNLGRRTLLGSLASGIAHVLIRASDAPLETRLADISRVLGALDIDDLVELRVDPADGQIMVHRRTCCLAFTLPTPRICAACCIRLG